MNLHPIDVSIIAGHLLINAFNGICIQKRTAKKVDLYVLFTWPENLPSPVEA